MNEIQDTINELHRMKKQLLGAQGCSVIHQEKNQYSAECLRKAIYAINKQVPKKVYHFLDADNFETTCCGIDITNTDYNFCPNCGCELGEVEEVEEHL
ncbi:MAG: hypothetical protein K0S04_314 [Herbinix sp.]|jgi:hypothetical protein|nr:hypothetical protein [Herbinix sp.]